jgi:hypothetical protein
MYILLGTFEQKMEFLPFSYISGGMGVYLTPLTPSTTTLRPGTPPANSRRTEQFLSHPRGL